MGEGLLYILLSSRGQKLLAFSPAALSSLMWLTGVKSSVRLQGVQPAEEERRSEGNVGLFLYVKYFRAGANFLVLFVLVLLNAVANVSSLCSFFV